MVGIVITEFQYGLPGKLLVPSACDLTRGVERGESWNCFSVEFCHLRCVRPGRERPRPPPCSPSCSPAQLAAALLLHLHSSLRPRFKSPLTPVPAPQLTSRRADSMSAAAGTSAASQQTQTAPTPPPALTPSVITTIFPLCLSHSAYPALLLLHSFSALHRAAAAIFIFAPALASTSGACGRLAGGSRGWAMPAHVLMEGGCSGWVGAVRAWVAVAEVRGESGVSEVEGAALTFLLRCCCCPCMYLSSFASCSPCSGPPPCCLFTHQWPPPPSPYRIPPSPAS